MRDINKAIKEGREIVGKRTRLDLSPVELNVFKEKAREGVNLDDIIYEAYLAGLAVGSRNIK